ncbi:hypothetical protein EWM64_g10398, partial [Hericium alpestre]
AQKLPPTQCTPLSDIITKHDVAQALKSSWNGTATSLNGLPYELWKCLEEHHHTTKKTQLKCPSFNVTAALTAVFQDIQTHGLSPGSSFSQGWMCLIYKKNDKSDIANYCPINLFNTDYKLFTKTLTTQLASSIHVMVHDDQTMILFFEAMEVDGVIIALDQEKAYNKVEHDYLWKTLTTYNLPDWFIVTVCSLYEHAKMKVAVNGHFSNPYCVTCSICQGDPLSCLLFDLAIEPLACMLWASPHLTGFHIPGTMKKVLVCLFADDMVLYLSAGDRYDHVLKILNSWCAASGAKFNINKTEVILMGSVAHHDRICMTQKLHPDNMTTLSNGKRITGDRDLIQYLGTYIGIDIDGDVPWLPLLDKL